MISFRFLDKLKYNFNGASHSNLSVIISIFLSLFQRFYGIILVGLKFI